MVDLINKQVKTYRQGIGTVVEQTDTRVFVKFANGIVEFEYGMALVNNLVSIDKTELDAIKADIAELEAAKRAAELDEIRSKVSEIRSNASGSDGGANAANPYVPTERVAGRALTYLVFQGTNYDKEEAGQYIFAPEFNQSGRKVHHWERLTELREGDVIFHGANKYILAISRVKEPYKNSPNPDANFNDLESWQRQGRKVLCDYHVLKTPIKHSNYKAKIIEFCNVKFAPFDKNGNGNMGYLYPLDINLAKFFIQEIAKQNPEVRDIDYLQFILAAE